jgi:hypothetical protein
MQELNIFNLSLTSPMAGAFLLSDKFLTDKVFKNDIK